MRRLLPILLLLSMLLAPATPASAETAAGLPVYFPETGHTLAYSFRQFWDRNGGLAIFGYPISEVFVENGRPVQYFERARFEWHSNLALVQAGLLGTWAARNNPSPAFARVQRQPGDNDYFVETGHHLSGGFREYWKNNGGLPVFGFPISEEFREVNPIDGKEYNVQYFERARFEWHPEFAPPHDVLLGHLGTQYVWAERPVPEWAAARVNGPEAAWHALAPTRIQMPRIGMDTQVIEGGFSFGQWDVPRYTAIHYWPIAAFPGTRGNITIAGHVGYSGIIFSQLPNAQVGDEVLVTVGGNPKRYRVTEIMTVLPEDSWVMGPTTTEVLTLITCVPIGVYTHRLIVRAVPIQ